MKLPALPRQLLLALMGSLLLAGFLWVATHSGPLAPIKVTVAKVDKRDIQPSLFGIGTVEARRDYLIGPTVPGRVLRVLVDVGDQVKAGQLLAEMDPVDLDQRASSSAAAAARARSLIASAEAQVQEARSRRDLASLEARRYSQLGTKEFVSTSVVDAKREELRVAEAQLAGAESALDAARKEQNRLEAEHGGLRQQRDNIRLLAPTDGVITARDAEPGSTVVAGQAVLKLIEPSSLWIKVRFDQARSTGLRTGLPAEINLRSQRGTKLGGQVVRLELLSDSVTEERLAHVAFDRLPDGVSIGEMADVRVGLPPLHSVLGIPNASLRLQGTKLGVWVREDGRLRFSPVVTGSESPDGMVEVVNGLSEGQEIVVYSAQELKADSRIEVVQSLAGKSK